MYESFYGLKEKPFTLLPDPDYLYLSPKHQRALTLLEYGMMNQAGFSVICGDTGAGKTTLIRRLLSELGDDTKVGLITNTHHSFGELLNWVLMAFGLDGDNKSKAQMHHMFIEFLIEQYADNKHTVLIVDEAQNMSADTLEELRMLSNINADKDQVLQVILAGQPALRETLRKPELMQFAQRIAVDYYLESLSVEETQAYIHHRLSVAGSQKQIFSDEACGAIFKYSGGTPRLINLLCDTALVYSFAEQTLTISEQLVHDVVREQHSNSIIPTFNTNYAEATTEPAANTQEVETPAVLDNHIDAVVEKHKSDNTAASLSQHSVQQTANVMAATTNAANSNVTNPNVTNHSVPVSQVTEKPVAEAPSEFPVEAPMEIKDESNVTPINANQHDLNIDAGSQAPEIAGEHLNKKQETFAESSPLQDSQPQENSAAEKAPYNPQQKNFTETIESSTDAIEIEKQSQASAAEPESEKNESDPLLGGQIASHREAEDVYPIVHIEENPKKGLSTILLALVGGMFVASIVMMVAAWMMFGGGAGNNLQNSQQNINQQVQRDVESRELKALEKERDAALAVTRALERERDAALQAAKAQEQIRAAEMRAAKILATQEREAQKRLQQARARAREAEKAESKARAREHKLKLKAEKREAELERQRLEMLREDRIRIEAQENFRLKQQQLNRARVEREAPVANVAPVTQSQPKPKIKKEESFSSNPCNSPSAKFLSTCKK